MKSTTDTGWVILSPDERILDFTFKRTRPEAIKAWNNVWSQPNWRKDKREGYKCVKAKQTTEIIQK